MVATKRTIEERTVRRLRAIRKVRGLSQQDVADASGVARVALAKIEVGGRGMSIDEAAALAEGLGLDLITLLRDEPIKVSRDVRVIE